MWGGGGAIYSFEEILEGSQVRYNDDYGAMLVDATPEQISFQFINRGGAVIDSFSISAAASASPPQVSAAPLDHTLALAPAHQGDLQAMTGLTDYTIQVALNYPDPTFAGHAQIDLINRETAPWIACISVCSPMGIRATEGLADGRWGRRRRQPRPRRPFAI